jgi:hypothetical protein
LDNHDEVRWQGRSLVGERELWAGPWVPGTTEILANTWSPTWSTIVAIDGDLGSGGEALWAGSTRIGVQRVLADGRLLALVPRPDSPAFYLTLIEPGTLTSLPEDPTATLKPLLGGSGQQVLADIHVDGDWLAYTSNENGPYEVLAVRLASQDQRIHRVSGGPGETPRWSPQGDGLYYRHGQRWYWVDFDVSAENPFREPEFFLKGEYVNVQGPEFEVSLDGSRLLALRATGQPTQSTLSLITGWLQELERLFPTEQHP